MADFARKIGRRGIYCLEGEWSRDLRNRTSVLPLLQMLEASGRSSFIHRDVGTLEEFELYIKRFRQAQYSHFEILNLAFHGSKGSLKIGNSNVSLEELAEIIGLSAEGKIIYFASCATLKVSDARLEAFQKATKARFVAGYTKNIEMILAGSFELALLDSLAYYQSPKSAFKFLENKATKSLGEELGFRRFPKE